MEFTRDDINWLHLTVDFFMENAAPLDDEDRIELESVIDKLIELKKIED